jgi:drug/metabolite transporter (DMT)-like permease
VSFYLIPIVGLAASALILGERLEPHQWLGTVVALASILAIFWLGRRQAEFSFEAAAAV